ncbi:MAG: lysine exporter LysO family protein [Anaerovoracaceae bacterium]|nr:lysine exporter LysO family protein [Anaerovoracaceae bacterium]
MGDLILYLGITLVGYILGSRLRSVRQNLGWTGKVQLVALVILVLLMGMRMGSNEEVTANISTIGVSAFLMTVVIMSFSVAAIWLARHVMKIDQYGRLQDGAATVETENVPEQTMKKTREESPAETAEEEKKGSNSTTIAILVSVVIGMVFGFFVIRRAFAGNMDTFDSLAGLGIKIGLCLLLIFVGMDLGLEGTVIDNFRKVGLRILVFPAAVIVGTLGGALLCSLFMDLSVKECLAVGAGFGWYTLAPGIIMENGYVTASAVSFLHNVMRELFSIVLIPAVAKKVGYIETTGMPGAAAMDVCLPIVEKSTRSDIAVYSFVSGVILSILVPILVPAIIG